MRCLRSHELLVVIVDVILDFLPVHYRTILRGKADDGTLPSSTVGNRVEICRVSVSPQGPFKSTSLTLEFFLGMEQLH